MKHVFDSRMVAHIWANQSQSDARNGQGNFYFRGETIFSYGSHFPIAAIIANGRKAQAVLFTTKRYSMTTSKHIGYVHGALRGRSEPVFHVEDVNSTDHAANLKSYQDRITELAGKASRARSNRDWLIERTEELAKEANAYAAFFGRKWHTPDTFTPEFLEEARKRSLLESKKEQAKRAAAAKKREQEREEMRAKYLVDLGHWAAGEDVTLPFCYWDGNSAPATRLRVRGDVVETSRGAEVPAEHAARLWPLVKRCRTNGTEYKRNGHTEHVGHFAVDAIDANGNLTAGCHFIEYAELERCAVALGQAV